MGKRRSPAGSGRKKAGASTSRAAKKPIEQYDHPDKKRVNIPPVGLVSPETDPLDTPAAPSKQYQYDPHLDPQLVWAGKAERTSFEIPTVSLHVHERIDPRTIIEAVRARNGNGHDAQLPLFARPEENPPLREAIKFYDHKRPLGWKNRLIAGDSLLVMNSLLEKEGLGGQVQMVYIDPPYGIRYGSNFQPFVNKRDVKDGSDDDLTQEPETLKAFRDTWELGIHSYLTYLRDRLWLAKDLLHESGSCFVQINDDNLHHVREVLDEVFGYANFVVTFVLRKKGSQKGELIDPINDYLLWYAKDKVACRRKFRPFYLKRKLAKEAIEDFSKVELDDGTILSVTDLNKKSEEEVDYFDAPDQLWVDYPGARLFSSNDLTVGGVRKNQSLLFEFQGRKFDPGLDRGVCWKHTARSESGELSGMDRLAHANRIHIAKGQIRFKRYSEDFPYTELSNMWSDIGGAKDRIYAVQTNPEIIKRCLLMTTDPGDLVLDPTCGSGTTAVVAEQWGRRWITTDTSRVAITLAKQRLMTATFDYYTLAHPDQGVGSGLKYKTVPHVTSSSIANNPEIREGMTREEIDRAIAKYADTETLYDRPEVDNKKARVTGPFTVEAVPAAAFGAPEVRRLDPIEWDEQKALPGMEPTDRLQPDASIAREGETLRQSEWRAELLKTGIRAKGGSKIEFVRVEALPGTRWLSADAETKEDKPRRAVVSFASPYAPLEQRQVSAAIDEAQKLVPRPALVIFAALQFDPEAAKDIDETQWPGVTLLKAQMNGDLVTEDLKKKRASNESFWLVGQPDISLRKRDGGAKKEGDGKATYVVEVHGFDYYDPKSGSVVSGGQSNIAMWMLDPDYDGRSLYPRQVFFPMSGPKDGWSRLAKNLRAEIDEELIEQYRGTVSLPFEAGKFGRVAVKIVDDRGIESLRIMDIE